MKKFYLLTFLLLSSTAMAGDTNSSIWEPVESDSSKKLLSVDDTTGKVESWSILDGSGDAVTAGDLEKAKTATRYQDTNWDEGDTAAAIEKVEETIKASNLADAKYDNATSARNESDDAYSNLQTLKNVKDVAETAYKDAQEQKEKDCAPGSVTALNCFNSIAEEAQAKDLLDRANTAYEQAQKESSAADQKFKDAVAELEKSNADVQKVMSKIDPKEALTLRDQMSNIDTSKWDIYMNDPTSRQMIQNQFAQLHQQYDVPNYDLSSKTGQEQAQKFVDSLNQTLQLKTQSDSLYYRLYMDDGSGTDDTPVKY